MLSSINTPYARRSDGAARRPLGFGILLFGIYLRFGILGFGICKHECHAAQSPSTLNQIYSNIGNINAAGLPQIKIPLGNVTELTRYGFSFAITHNIVPAYNGSARTEWRITGLRTCVYLDDNGDLVWVRPGTQRIVFKKAENYRHERLGWAALIRKDTRDVELTNSSGQKWSYKGGFFKKITDRFGSVDFITDQETVLLASREWNNNGVRTNYTWVSRDGLVKNISFGIAPVRLRSDSEFHYEYDEVESVSILRVFRHDGSFVSETRFGGGGIIQKAGDKTLRAIRRNDGTGRKLVIDSE